MEDQAKSAEAQAAPELSLEEGAPELRLEEGARLQPLRLPRVPTPDGPLPHGWLITLLIVALIILFRFFAR